MEHNNKSQGEVFEQTNVVVSAPKRDYFIPISILIAGIVIAGAVLFASLYKGGSGAAAGGVAAGNNNNVPTAPAANASQIMALGPSDVILGNSNAPVTIIEYGDYQCPFCTAFFSQTQPLLVANYVNTGKVKFVFRNFIVNDRTATEHESHNSALAAECSKDQNKFWQFHDALYAFKAKDEAANPQGAEDDNTLVRSEFMSIAQSIGMDTTQFASCYDSGKYTAQVQAQSDQAEAFGVNATPTFYVNGQQIVGAQPYSAFQAAIASAQ